MTDTADSERGGLKPLVDVLVRLGWLYRDDMAWLEHGEHKQQLARGAGEQVVVEIAYLPTEGQSKELYERR